MSTVLCMAYFYLFSLFTSVELKVVLPSNAIDTLTNSQKVYICSRNKVRIKNNNEFLNTKQHRNNTNFTYKSLQKERHRNISRNYYTINNKNIYSSKLNVTKSDIDKIKKLVIILKNRHIKNKNTNQDQK